MGPRTPPALWEVAATATIDRDVRKLDEKALAWGREEMHSTATERIGSLTQPFLIGVRPDKSQAAP